MTEIKKGYKESEIGVIPEGWEVVKLEQIVIDTHQGINTVTENVVYTDEGIDILQAKHITSEVIDLSDPRKVSLNTYNKYKEKYQAKIDDLLLTNIGTIGKVVKVEEEIPFLIAWNIFLIKLNKNMCSSEFILNFFRNLDRINYYDKHLTGNATKFINKKIMNEIKIPLPPLKEQEKIADILSTADEKIDAIASQIQKAETLKKGLLQKLLSEGINHCEFKDSELGKIPESWEIDKLENLTTKIGDGLHGTPKYVEQSDYYFINGNNLNGESIEITENTKCVSKEEYIKNKKTLDDTTVLLSINGTVGSLAYYNNETVMLGKSVAYMNSNNKILKQFLFYLLKSSKILDYFMLELTGTTIKNLSLKTIRNTKIPLPPLKEQKQIANILSTADEKLELLRAKKEKYEELKKGLLQKLLSGEVRTV